MGWEMVTSSWPRQTGRNHDMSFKHEKCYASRCGGKDGATVSRDDEPWRLPSPRGYERAVSDI